MKILTVVADGFNDSILQENKPSEYRNLTKEREAIGSKQEGQPVVENDSCDFCASVLFTTFVCKHVVSICTLQAPSPIGFNKNMTRRNVPGYEDCDGGSVALLTV
eukprot:375362-Amphidinium_carterae.1